LAFLEPHEKPRTQVTVTHLFHFLRSAKLGIYWSAKLCTFLVSDERINVQPG
jgi:hypothetical protein